jgi:hypothetical protein
MMTAEEIKKLNIHQRLQIVREKIDYVQKDQKKVGGQYTSVKHDAVVAAVRPAMVEARIGTSFRVVDSGQDGNRTWAKCEIDFINIDEPADFFTCSAFGYGIDSQDKGPGKAMSYSKKYLLLNTFLLETGDDPDNESIDHDTNKPGAIEPIKEANKPAEAARVVLPYNAPPAQPQQQLSPPAQQQAPRGTGLTEKQVKMIYAKAHSAGYNIDLDLKPFVLNAYGVEHFGQIHYKDLQTLCKMIDEKQIAYTKPQMANEVPPYSDADIPF